MRAIELNGFWTMRNVKEEKWIEARVPGTVIQDLLNAGMAPEPYYRDNENKMAPLLRDNYEYRHEFTVDGDVLSHEVVELCCEGLDTLATIRVNGKVVAKTDNMHRTYRFDMKDFLTEGKNELNVLLESPLAFAEKAAKEGKGMSLIGGKGIEFLRKAQCMFGWDWGLVLPDQGIWRDIYIEIFDTGRFRDVKVLQKHIEGRVTLNVVTECEQWAAGALEVAVTVTAPDGKILRASAQAVRGGGACGNTIEIPDPQLWWPNGFGAQPLYQVEVALKDGERVLDARQMQIGLRTIYLRREEDEWGRSYEFTVNGNPTFIKGSNLVIENAMLGRYSREKTEKMIQSCVAANFNCIRVWGGALFPPDYFYDLCDQYGLILYHDLMFACNFYPTDEAFIDNVERELTDNIGRIRHHASLGLWCGNNEIEVIYSLCSGKAPSFAEVRKILGIPELEEAFWNKVLDEYKKLFYDKIPRLLEHLDPQTSFVNSSPSGDEPGMVPMLGGSDRGDAHYYLAYDNMAPYTKFRGMQFRFVSEMGFQSYPSIKTIHAFTQPEDRKPYSDVMLKHQKCINGNQTIETYMGRDYKVPEDFERYVYASQMLGGEIMRYCVEHLRRNIGRTMGVITWQLNDCWPAVSWAGLDYYGRWKAQQYYTKRFYAPVLISALDEGEKIDLLVTNDRLQDVRGIARWRLLTGKSELVEQGEAEITVAACAAICALHLDFGGRLSDENRADRYLAYSFAVDGEAVSEGTALFVKPKDFHFIDPSITFTAAEDEKGFLLTVKSAAFAKAVALDLRAADCIFSDNYFDLTAGEAKKIRIDKSNISQKLELNTFRQQLTVISVYDIS
jgi:Beta-galactosidase/beta-glucuronidase